MRLPKEQWRNPALYPEGITYGTFTFPATVAAVPGSANSRNVTIYYQNRYIDNPAELTAFLVRTTNNTTATYRRWKFGLFNVLDAGGIGSKITDFPYADVNAFFHQRNGSTGSSSRIPCYMLPNSYEIDKGWVWIGLMLEHTYTTETALGVASANAGSYRMYLGGFGMSGDVSVTSTTTNITTATWANSSDGSGYTNTSTQPNIGLIFGEE